MSEENTTLESSGQETQTQETNAAQSGQDVQPENNAAQSGKDEQPTKAPEKAPAWLDKRLEQARRSERKAVLDEIAEEKRKAELSADERAKEAEEAAERAKAEADTRVLNAERKANLTGKVSNPDRVLKLMDSEDFAKFFDGSKPNTEAILEAFPEYAPQAQGIETPNIHGAQQKGFTRDDVLAMTPEQINANWDKIKHIKI